MRIQLNKIPFTTQGLTIETAGWFKGPRVFQNGAEIPGKKGVYPLKTDQGTIVDAKLIGYLWDPIPTLKVGEEVIQFAPPFKWYELTWTLLPFTLLFAMGLIGGVAGTIATISTGKILRGKRSVFAKYTTSAAINIAITLAAAIFAIIFAEMFHAVFPKP